MTDLTLSIQSGVWFLGCLSLSDGASRVLRTQWTQKFVKHLWRKSLLGAL
jgi:hypothetical protein